MVKRRKLGFEGFPNQQLKGGNKSTIGEYVHGLREVR